MTEHDVLVGRYIDTWNETNPSRRDALAELVLLDGARYTDPMMSSTGPNGFAESDRRISGADARVDVRAGRRD